MNLPRIGFVGRARTGKDTAVSILQARGYQRAAFADPLRGLVASINPLIVASGGDTSCGVRYAEIVARIGYENAKDHYPEVRRFLQHLGTEARNHLGQDVWVDALTRTLDGYHPHTPVAVSDVRFPNEAAALRQRGFTLVRLTRAAAEPASDHVSETAMDDIHVDHTYANDATIADLDRFLCDIILGLPLRWAAPTTD